MRIAILSTMTGVPWGGSEELWFDMAREARAAGHEVAVALCRPYDAAGPLGKLTDLGVTLLAPPRVIGGGRWQSVKKRVLDRMSDAYQSVLDWRPDVACVSMGMSDDVAVHRPLRPLAATLGRRPFPYVVVCQANNEAVSHSPEVVGILGPFLAAAGRVAFVADENRITAERQLARSLPNATVVRNPVNLTDVSAVPWPADPVARLATVARLSVMVKGQDALLEALADLRWPAEAWTLDLYGRGEDEGHLRNLASFYGLAANVRFPGFADDLRGLWAKTHLLVMPSRMEGTPLALVEAMLCGRPAVVTDVGGNREWVTEGETGWVADGPTRRSLAGALGRAWADRENWPDRGRAARDVAGRLYDPTPGRTLLSIVTAAAGG